MGIGARIVGGTWSFIALGLLIAGIVLIGLWVLFLDSFAPGFWGRRSTQVGTNAFLATLSVLLILGLINFLAVRSGIRVDLTENQLFTLSPLSQRVVQNLEQPLKVWVFNPNPNPADRRLLENYRRYGSNLEFKFVDPQKELRLTEKFDVQSLGEVYLEYGSERQLLQTVNQIERLSEIKLTNGIAKLTSDRTDTVYFLQGHGETPLEPGEGGLFQAVNALEDKNFTVATLNLTQKSAVPPDASVVVIASPKEPLFEAEVKTLEAYLAQGGSLLVMFNPDINPGLDSLLADWGVEFDERIVIDPSGQLNGFGLATSIVYNYGAHPITQDFAERYSLYPLARSVETTPVEGIEETPLVITNEETWAESDLEEQPLDFNPESDRQGPLNLGVALSRPITDAAAITENGEDVANDSEASPQSDEEETEPILKEDSATSPTISDAEKAQEKDTESRLVVFGNSDFATNGWFEQQLNGDVFLNSISWLSNEEEEVLSIRPKEPENRRINLTEGQRAAFSWTVLLFVPLFGFTTAGFMWWQRR
ncbi:MAG: ABC transporter [Symploca sp. SIO2E6]|nr:ABC transporter [Symploca sp. SIO2E6]